MLTEGEMLMLKSAGLTFSQIVGLFTSGSSTAFQCFCSLITRGIASSPNRTRKRSSLQELFVTLRGNSEVRRTSPTQVKLGKRETKAEDIFMSYMQMSRGLQFFSPRIVACPIDEILTLPLLVDIDGDGLVSWDDFYAFCTLCDEAQYNHVSNPQHCFECLFIDLINEKIKNTSKSAILKKLSDCIQLLRENSVSTMNVLLESVDSCKHDAMLSQSTIDIIFQRIEDEINSLRVNVTVQNSVTSNSPKRLQSTTSFSNDLNDALKGLRENTKLIANRLTRQEKEFQSAQGLWFALKNLEKEIDSQIASSANRLADNTSATDPKAGGDSSDTLILFEQNSLALAAEKSTNDLIAKSRVSPKAFDRRSTFDKEITVSKSRDVTSLIECTPSAKSSRQLRCSSASRIIGRSDISPISTAGFSDYDETLVSHNSRSPQSRSGQFYRIGLSPTQSQFVATLLDQHRATLEASMKISMKKSTSNTSLSTVASAANSPKKSIFRSPSTHIHGNRNSYDDKSGTWRPTVVSNRKNERFQSPTDWILQNKINAFLYT